MPWPRRTRSEAELIRQIDTLSTKLLQVNAALRLKTLCCERLEVPPHQRCNRIDQLYGLLEQARQQNAKLEREAEHLAALIATSPDNNARIPKLIARAS